MRLTGDPEVPRLKTVETDTDLTDQLAEWAKNKVNDLASVKLNGFIFKSRSPSCGLSGIEVFSNTNRITGYGTGIFAWIFCEKFPGLFTCDETFPRDYQNPEEFLAAIRSGTHQ
jgi:uncharacterized protein YbbK (DUF523 family)